MRVANLSGRLVLVKEGGAVDVEKASDGRLPSSPQAAYAHWDELREWASSDSTSPEPFDEADLGAPAPFPRQVFALALNYAPHAAEAGRAVPAKPSIFPKYPTSVGPPNGEVLLSSNRVDWEVELVVVIGRHGHFVDGPAAWDHVAGVAVGQDITDRMVQFVPPMPQFGMGKSFPGFSPFGPHLVTPDELADPDDISLRCLVDDEVVQEGRTSELVFSVPEVISHISGITPLLPGDAIFMGTFSGIGFRREPPRFLQPGQVLTSTAEGIGSIQQTFVAGPRTAAHDDLPAPLQAGNQ